MSIFWLLFTAGIFVLLEAFFSGSEMGVISVNRIKLEQLAQSNVPSAVLIKRLLRFPDRLLSTTLVGTNLSVVISSALFTALVADTLGKQYVWLTTLVMTPIILIFGEAIPKAVFRYYADRITLRTAKMLRFFSVLFWPVAIAVTYIARIMLLPFRGKQEAKKSLFVTREELKLLIRESKKDDEIKPHERAIIHRIFEFGSKKVKEIMVPIKDVISIEAQDSPKRLKELSREKGFSRIPVYKGKKENIIGFANVFDALYEQDKCKRLLDCLRPVLYIFWESPIDKVFFSLQLERKQIAVLVDADKNQVGIVTFKDLLDEIVGEL
ncbi:MAG: HlyC/CorC family transporter [Candidatus Omnitrophica bacterium]|nr:HlyC/CorC family transporter [Candidatus Omnitrophota bacterium]